MFISKNKFFFLTIFIVTLAVALMLVQPVSADDGTPADPTAATETSTAPELTVTETPAETTELPAIAAETPTVEATIEPAVEVTVTEPPAVEAAVTEAPTAADAPAEPEPVLAETVTALAESGLEVVDAEGETLPLATRDSGNLTMEGDPWFQVGTTIYHFAKDCTGFDNCIPDANPIQRALAFMDLKNLTPTDRTLYIQADTYSDDVVVNGTLNGVKGLLKITKDPLISGTVEITGSVTIHDMPAGFTLSNITVNNTDDTDAIGIYAYNNKGTITLTDVNATASGSDSSGIVIRQTGNVVLNRVEASGNGYEGADITASGSVAITNSAFDDNLAAVSDGNSLYDYGVQNLDGLLVSAWGTLPVTLNGVSATGNAGSGVVLNNSDLTPVTIKNGLFNGNSNGDGVLVYGSKVVLENITADDNSETGIVSLPNNAFTGTRLSANGNGSAGVFVDTCRSDAAAIDPQCQTTGVGTVTINNSSATDNGFSASTDGNGFLVWGKGAITLYDVFSGDNKDAGFYLENNEAILPAPIKLTLVTADHNRNGLLIYSNGAVTVTNVVATYNPETGVSIYDWGIAPVTITISSSTPALFNEIGWNGNNGYFISALGPISITSLNSHDNGMYGGYITNASAATPMPVTIKTLDTVNTISKYYANEYGGLRVYSYGAVVLSFVSVNDNGGDGAVIDNHNSPALTGVPVTISNSSFSENCKKKLDGTCDGVYLSIGGLQVLSKGVITLTNVSANGNYGFGAHLNNQGFGTIGPVNITAGTGKVNEFSNNFGDGLQVYSDGTITTYNIIAAGNSGYGAYINNLGNALNSIVKISQTISTSVSGNIFNGNQGGGLYIVSDGAVSVAFYQARENDPGSGIFIDATAGLGAVTVTGTTVLSGNLTENFNNGIDIVARGNIVLSKLDASSNGSLGASLVNDTGPGSISITTAYFNNNDSGLYVRTASAITWKNGSANNNTLFGADLSNQKDTLPGKAVTITGVSASSNGSTGLTILTKGAVLLTNVGADDNSANYGSAVYGSSYNDTLSTDQTWIFNGESGQNVIIDVDWFNFTPWIAVYGPDGGLVSDDAYSTSFTVPETGTYTIKLSSLEGIRGYYTLDLYTDVIAKGSVSTYTSDARGIRIDNSAGVNAPVTILNSVRRSASNSSGPNVEIFSSGIVSITGLDLNDSGVNGLTVNNIPVTTGTPGVTLTNVSLDRNHNNGADIQTLGAVTVKNGSARTNFFGGYSISNDSGTALMPITMTNVVVSDSGNTYGIYLRSNGAVTLTTVTSDYNGNTGIDIDTRGAVTMTAVNASHNTNSGVNVVTLGAVTINKPASGYNNFTTNFYNGLDIDTAGRVTLNRVNATGNGGRDINGDPLVSGTGVDITVSNALGTSPVILTDILADYNTGTGVFVYTTGAMTLTLVEADDNELWGLYLDQTNAPSNLFATTLSKISADRNGYDGIYAEVYGSITLSKFTANYNEGSGVYLTNYVTDLEGNASNAPVTILNPAGGLSDNQVIGNGNVGIEIVSGGAIRVTGLKVENNFYDGLIVINEDSTTKALVTLTGLTIRGNGTNVDPDTKNNGVYVISRGIVTISNSISVGNKFDGFHIEVWSNNAYITNTSSMGNGRCGLFIDLGYPLTSVFGNLTLSRSSWFGNAGQNLAIWYNNLYIL